MRTRHFVFGGLLLLGVCGTAYLRAQDPSDEVRTGDDASRHPRAARTPRPR